MASLRPLASKSKFIRQFSFSKNLGDLYGNFAEEQDLTPQQHFYYKSSSFFQKFILVI